MTTPLTTITGRQPFTVQFADGRTEEITISQLPIGRYQSLMTPSAAQPVPVFMDEIALTAALCGKSREWITGKPPAFEDGLTPESYELLRGAAWELNEKGFFAYAARREAANREQFLALPEEVRNQAVASASRLLSPGSPPARG
jgi:hypothetical protein